MRKYMPDNVRYSMSKPTKEMIEEIINSIEERDYEKRNGKGYSESSRIGRGTEEARAGNGR